LQRQLVVLIIRSEEMGDMAEGTGECIVIVVSSIVYVCTASK